jgi:hypothetical protein
MTEEQVRNLKLGIAPIDERTTLIINGGLEWITKNTTLNFDMNNFEEVEALPYGAKLFFDRFF